MFFIASITVYGYANVSPKASENLQILSAERMIWLNLSGSSNETAAHVQENNRIVLMFCVCKDAALIVQVYGEVRVISPRNDELRELIKLFPDMPGSRQILDIELEFAQASCGSCGSGALFYEVKGQRGEARMLPICTKMGKDDVKRYRNKKNQTSIDSKATHLVSQVL